MNKQMCHSSYRRPLYFTIARTSLGCLDPTPFTMIKSLKLCRTSCWNIPGHAVRTSSGPHLGCPENNCYKVIMSMLKNHNCRTPIHCSYICIGGRIIRLKCKNKTLQDILLECPQTSCWNVPGRPLGMS